MSLESFFNRCWYRTGMPLWPLLPLEWLWRGVTALRRRGLQRGRIDGVPVIVVGNISIGGTGKTPVVLALVQHLQAKGMRPGVISRGYGGSAGDQPLLVAAATAADQAGDEAALIARRSGVPVAVCRRRLAAARLLIDAHDCDVLVSDDGLQHYALPRSFELVVVDSERGFGNGRCVPVGPLREMPLRLQSVDAVLFNGTAQQLDTDINAHGFTLQPQCFVNLLSNEEVPVALWRQAGSVHAFAGIGHPQRFFTTLKQLGLSFEQHAFADHQQYREADIRFAGADAVIMTEKDAVKCAAFAGPEHWYLRVQAQLPAALLQSLDETIGNTDQ